MSWHSHEPEQADAVAISMSAAHITVVHPSEVDKRYRILVMLQRSDRPNYWVFSCPHCKHDVYELTNCEIESMSDLVAMGTNPTDVLVGSRCDGPYCRYYYYFKLNGLK